MLVRVRGIGKHARPRVLKQMHPAGPCTAATELQQQAKLGLASLLLTWTERPTFPYRYHQQAIIHAKITL